MITQGVRVLFIVSKEEAAKKELQGNG